MKTTESTSSGVSSSESEVSILDGFKKPSMLPKRTANKKLTKSAIGGKRKSFKKPVSRIPSRTSIPIISVQKDENNNILVDCQKIEKVDKIAKHFQKSRSHSQMDFKTSRKMSNMYQSSNSSSYVKTSSSTMAVCALSSNSAGSSSGGTGPSSGVSEDFYFMMKGAERMEGQSRVAGMKIFASVMLNAWRKRRQDVKQLTEEMCRLKKGAIKVKNQIHVISSLYKIEQKQNEELRNRVKHLMEDTQKQRKKIASLEDTNSELKGDMKVLEKQLEAKEREIDGENALLSETKSELFKAMSQVRELESLLSSERRNLQELENNKNDLISEVIKLRAQGDDRELGYIGKIDLMEARIFKLNRDIDNLEKALICLKNKEKQIPLLELREKANLRKIAEMTQEIDKLKSDVEATWSHKITAIFTGTVIPTSMHTLRFIHLMTYLLLPATPPPEKSSFPVYFGWKKCVSVGA